MAGNLVERDAVQSTGRDWIYPISEIRAGLLAPLDAVGFLWRRKILLLLCLTVQIVAFVGYFWALSCWVFPAIEGELTKSLANLSYEWLRALLEHGAVASLYLLAFLLYALVMLPIVNVLAGPLFDWVSAEAYAEFSGEPVRSLSLGAVVRSLLFEVVKTAFLIGLLALTLLSYVAIFLAPIVLIVAIWYCGWEQMDRTLGALGYRPLRRVGFGLVHFVACMSLGVWMVIPFFGTLFAFAFAPAGAIAVARVVARSSRHGKP
jgi:hypothetical protein